MGKADSLTKQYMQDTAVFADVFNYYIYKGRQVIKPEQLHELDTTMVLSIGKGTASTQVQKYRDVLKYATAMEDGNTAYVVLGIENQTHMDYAMPIRNGLYDFIQYGMQASETARKHRREGTFDSEDEFLSGFGKDDRIIPVITLVFYFGTDRWTAPRSLHEMFRRERGEDDVLLRYVPDYKINLIEPAAMTDDDIGRFQTDLRNVVSYIRCGRDKNRMNELLANDMSFQNVRRLTAELLNEITDTRMKIPDKEGNVNMCKAIQDMRNEAIQIGRAEGRAEERFSLLNKLVKESVLTFKNAAAMAEISEEQFKEQYEKAMSV